MREPRAAVYRRAWVVFWLSHYLLFVVVWYQNRADVLGSGGGPVLIAIGALFGMLAMYTFLSQFVMISGISPLERVFGLDRLSHFHHRNGILGWILMLLHVQFIVLGYSDITGVGFVDQFRQLVGDIAFGASALAAVVLINFVVISSIVIVRRRLRYEWWRLVHFLVYAAIALAIFHQLDNGQELLAYRWLRWYWIGMAVFAFGAVIYMRYARPLLLYSRHKFKVDRIMTETKGVTSIYIRGDDLSSFDYQPGQFSFWHFWQSGFRTQKHPFTISSSPSDPYLRLSAKAIGDYSSKLSEIKPGTPVLVNGPYGRFSPVVSTRRKRLFIAGGIGITPIRSMLGQARKQGDVLIYSARSQDDLAFYDEIESWRDEGLHSEYYLDEISTHASKHVHQGRMDAARLKRLVADDIKDYDVWLCGPPPMMDAIEKLLLDIGAQPDQIHTERFRL